MCRKNHSCLSLRFSDLFVIQQNCRDKGVYLESAPSLYKSLKVLYYCPCAKPAHVGAGARAGAGSCLSPKHREQSSLCAGLVQNRLQCAEFRTRSATKTLFHLERVLVSSKLKISVKLYLSPSHLQSVGAQLGGLGDGQKIRKRTKFLMVRKAIPSIFPDFLELKPFLCRITVGAKKIGRCWKSAAADLWNGRWMGSACDSGLKSLRFKARGTNYVVPN